ncbi:TVP38/TMEM64 family protein [Campylobacter sp. FMV-PI01]|uniref:TVP38/TMEM64 family membrane protein n=1 Tax=Campylobacter portucalensis TaxID=2608384 RepID=A0A6L5WHW8_9BACT|nr:TVP38/TMEM64 family protein [Campylobacter portucalensis]
MKTIKKEKLFKITALILIILVSILVYLNTKKIENFIVQNQELSIIIYIISWMILPIFLFPVPILAFIGGAMFGLILGTIYTMIGAMINIILMYYIGKFLSLEKLKIKIEDSFMAVLILRFIPIVPYNALNYACGFLKIGLKNYILASFVGIIPGTIILINLGKNVLNFGSKEFNLGVFYLLLLTIISLGLKKWHSQSSLSR